MGVLSDAKLGLKVVRDLLAGRAVRSRLASQLAERGPLPSRRFEIGVYFADGAVNLYQMRQWYAPLAELDRTHPVVVLSRSPDGTSALLEESPVPVAYVRKVQDLEDFLEEHELKVVLYVNQNSRNFQMMRYGRRWHVFINHGESDKMYMTTNQFKAYDYSFVAGDAAIARLERVLWDYDFDKRALPIGRPQADHYTGLTPYQPDDRTVVLYAPTWEGDRSAAAYGSVATHGVALVNDILASPSHRLIYRPHPRSGVLDPAYGAANRAIVAAIAAANRADPSAQHVYDTGAELGWQLAAADVAIVDISAMVYDRLATGKPLLITRPVAEDAQIDTGGYLSDCEWLLASEAGSVRDRIDQVSHDSAAGVRLGRWVRHYFGDTTPGTATRRFHEAIEKLLAEWTRNAALHARDEPVDVHQMHGAEERDDL
ncbi:CDP-glycerol glycerophosphotransferase family protein [Herbiconiux sp. CPCC 203407]|uniref:CDP-glycerol glycerophosphotransferase family protein n=1 Tax=Herbiconiux oxytropis TaxID=2970915 RepID=A0AA41XI33_9MICO|nr:CDP-glycerol glycerophosphotransferase family protein [Herbiconiux oxytropis]MCS5721281.1 CDP-glycerol glycerophosphotransferase family protein [Herbiconiux oxytropis]MCS5726280.1 CDP-glycerol glycerophosphotransferase family protein [Herbiconiux oxytropis]